MPTFWSSELEHSFETYYSFLETIVRSSLVSTSNTNVPKIDSISAQPMLIKYLWSTKRFGSIFFLSLFSNKENELVYYFWDKQGLSDEWLFSGPPFPYFIPLLKQLSISQPLPLVQRDWLAHHGYCTVRITMNGEMAKDWSLWTGHSIDPIQTALSANWETNFLAFFMTCTFDSMRCLRAAHVGVLRS